MLQNLILNQFDYNLPDDRIAYHPVDPRDTSKLLFYSNGQIADHGFQDLPTLLPDNTLLVFNDSRVIPARLFARTLGGATIEIFLLSPVDPHEMTLAMQTQQTGIWECMIRNKRRWKNDQTLTIILNNSQILTLAWHDRDAHLVRLSWDSDLSFAEILRLCGHIPLPPYIKRADTAQDQDTYQTVYAKNDGAVAAPTAGLHFTDRVFEDLVQRGIDHDFVTLHVGAGTFQPVSVEAVIDHDMHTERFEVSHAFLQKLSTHDGPIIPVGTTSMRVLESLYWLAVKGEQNLTKNDAYDLMSNGNLPSRQDAFKQLADHFPEGLRANTQIYIMPGYDFQSCDGLVTNFHQPKSTLIMLVAALIGDDWQHVYTHAIANHYRFFSYGDSSLLLR